MKAALLAILVAALGSSRASPRSGFGPGLQDWGYIDPRPGAHMFYWLHYTLAKVVRFDERPLIITFEGGPGVAASGVGNFAESGPIDMFLKPRLDSWVYNYNVLYVDNPVGVGFSYVDSDDLFVETDEEFANDTVAFLKEFFSRDSGVQKSPVYFVGVSYAGKLVPVIAAALEAAIQRGEIDVDFRGIAMGNAAISTIDNIVSYAPYLLQLGLIEDKSFEVLNALTSQVKALADADQWAEAFDWWMLTLIRIIEETGGMNPYFILLPAASSATELQLETLTKLMNGPVAQTLGTNITWELSNPKVTNALANDILRPVDHLIPKLLDETDLKVVVFSGHLDLIVDHPGTVAWIKRLEWSGKDEFWDVERTYVVNDELIDAQLRHFRNFYLYTVIRAGHNVVNENRNAMKYILKEMAGY